MCDTLMLTIHIQLLDHEHSTYAIASSRYGYVYIYAGPFAYATYVY